MGITANQVKFIKDGFLGKVGEDRSKMLNVINVVLGRYANEFIGSAIKNAEKASITYKGNLQSDLTVKVTETSGGFEIEIGYPTTSPAAEYYDFQNKGVAGVGKSIASPYSFKTMYPSRKMVTQILLWIRDGKNKSRFEGQTQNLSALQTKRKRLSDAVDSSNNFKALAYGTATNIKKNGIKQTLYFDNAITSTFNKDFVNVLSKALAADVSLKLIQTNGNNN